MGSQYRLTRISNPSYSNIYQKGNSRLFLINQQPQYEQQQLLLRATQHKREYIFNPFSKKNKKTENGQGIEINEEEKVLTAEEGEESILNDQISEENKEEIMMNKEEAEVENVKNVVREMEVEEEDELARIRERRKNDPFAAVIPHVAEVKLTVKNWQGKKISKRKT